MNQLLILILTFCRKKFLIALLVIIIGNLSATIINIPADQPTIQAGIDIAVEGDTVLVAPGTYLENISIFQKNDIHVIGSGADVTTIDGNENGHVVVFNVASGSICDFTIINSGNNPSYACGIFTSQSIVLIENNIVAFNNRGISVSSSSEVQIHRNKIINNTGYRAITIISSTGYISYNLIADNLYHGIYNNLFSSLTLLNNTIIGNNDHFGLLLKPTVHLIVRNNIIINFGYGILVVGDQQSAVPLVDIAYNDVWNNSIANYWEDYYIGTYLYSQPFLPQPGTGEIHEDPLFLDPLYGDYHLQSCSPCIDAGDPNYPLDPDGTITDIGAYYYHQNSEIDDNMVINSNVKLNNYPNPFNPAGAGRSPGTTISYDLPVNIVNPVIEIFNIKGEKIRQYSIFNPSNAGQVFQSSIVWDGTDNYCKPVSSGVYLYRIKTDEVVLMSKKMLLLK